MTTYERRTGDVLVPGARPATELQSPVGGFIAGCGEAAAAVLVGVMKGTPPSPSLVTQLIQQAVAGGQTVGGAAAGGQSTPGNLTWLLAQNGVPVTSLDYSQALQSYAGVRPIEIGVSNAAAFGGSDSHVGGHYVTVVGRTTVQENGKLVTGYITSDPNTTESTQGQYVVYTANQFRQANPFWAAVPSSTPPSALSGSLFGQAMSSNTAGASTSGGGCQHSVSLFPGNTTCLDPLIGFTERGVLVTVGVAAIIMAIVIFARSSESAPAQALRSGADKLGAVKKVAAFMV